MTERTSWRCTGCGCVHAPHVDTCPVPPRVVVTEWPAELRPVPDFPMTPGSMKVERRPASDHAIDALAGDHVAACCDHASPKPSPLRYRSMMGDIDA